MRNQKGKINISSILITVMLVYGAFAAYKVIASRVTKTQIKSEIIEKFGFIRGSDFTVEKGEQVIREIMTAHNLYVEDVSGEEADEYKSGEEKVKKESTATKIAVEVQEKEAKVWFAVEYTDTIDFLFFKSKVRYYIEEEMLNYN